MIEEARRCGSRGWALNDAHCRQQKESFESPINQSLYSTTFSAYGSKARSCTTCMLPDHMDEECALHPNREVPLIRMSELAAKTREETRLVRPEGVRKKPRKGACFAWNGTRKKNIFEHACSKCFSRDYTRPSCPDGDRRASPRLSKKGWTSWKRLWTHFVGSICCLACIMWLCLIMICCVFQ